MSKQRRANLKSFIGDFAEVVETGKPAATQPADTPAPAADAEPAAAVTTPEPAPQAEAAPSGEVIAMAAKSRSKKGTLKERAKQMSVYLEEPAYEQLREIAFHERKKLHELMLEGLDLLFKKRGVKSLAQLSKGQERKAS